MTFLTARIITEKILSTYSMYIAALEPVPGNFFQYKLGDQTMYGQAKDLGNIPQLKRCIVALGSYTGGLQLFTDTLMGFASQMCPEPIGTNALPYIRPFIFSKPAHNSWDYGPTGYNPNVPEHIAYFYAGFPVADPFNPFNKYINTHGKHQDTYKNLAVTGGDKFHGRRIFNVTFDWDKYRIRKRDVADPSTFKARLDALLAIEQPAPQRTAVYRYAMPRLLQACHTYQSINQVDRPSLFSSHGADGSSRVARLLERLTTQLELGGWNNNAEPLQVLLQAQALEATDYECSERLGRLDDVLRDLIKNHRINSQSFSGDPFKADAKSFGYLVIRAFVDGLPELPVIQGDTRSVLGLFIQQRIASLPPTAYIDLTKPSTDATMRRLVLDFKSRYEKS